MKISVIIPVYNVGQYLEQCLNSVINQSYTDLEIILVDDGSTDQSADICDAYKKKDSRITVIHQLNGGVSSARNTGIELATGDYITFVDSDDWLDKEMYRKLIEVADSSQSVDVVMCDFVNVKTDEKENISVNIRKGYYAKNEIVSELYPTLLVTENLGRIPIVSACTCLFKRELLSERKIRFNVNLRFSEDYLFMANVMLAANSFYYLKQAYFYNYRQYELSRSKKYQSEWWSNFLYLNKELRKLLTNNKEFDFERQIKLQLIHSALFLSSAIYIDRNINRKEKINFLRTLFNDKDLKSNFSNIKFNKQSLGLKIVLSFVQYRMPRSYLFYRCIVSKIKKINLSF